MWRLFRMTAVDVSELYKLSEALEKSNLQMRKLHRRLHRYEQNMDDYVKSREVLEAKMQIHRIKWDRRYTFVESIFCFRMMEE